MDQEKLFAFSGNGHTDPEHVIESEIFQSMMCYEKSKISLSKLSL